MRKVKYEVYEPNNSEGSSACDPWVLVEKVGYFHQFAIQRQYETHNAREIEVTVALVEDETGKIIKVGIDQIQFLEPPIMTE